MCMILGFLCSAEGREPKLCIGAQLEVYPASAPCRRPQAGPNGPQARKLPQNGPQRGPKMDPRTAQMATQIGPETGPDLGPGSGPQTGPFWAPIWSIFGSSFGPFPLPPRHDASKRRFSKINRKTNIKSTFFRWASAIFGPNFGPKWPPGGGPLRGPFRDPFWEPNRSKMGSKNDQKSK